jgi:hypothetical protein
MWAEEKEITVAVPILSILSGLILKVGRIHTEEEINMIGRRQFLTTVGMLGMGVLFAKGVSATNRPESAQSVDYFPHLLSVLDEQAQRWGFELEKGQKECLAYTCENIRPVTHIELATVVAFGEGFLEDWKPIIDEYVRRKGGMPSMLYDHPLLEMAHLGVPSTYRVMLFKEQLIALLGELTDEGQKKSTERLYTYLKRRDIKPLRDVAKVKYQESLTDGEFGTLERIIQFHAGYSKQYTYCSTMAARAENLARAAI